MTDEHKALAEQYDLIAKALEGTDEPSNELLAAAVCHILARLGPPTAEEAADIGIAEDQG